VEIASAVAEVIVAAIVLAEVIVAAIALAGVIVAAIASAEAIAATIALVEAIVPARCPVAVRQKVVIEVRERAVAASRQPPAPPAEEEAAGAVTRWAMSHRAAPQALNPPAADQAMRVREVVAAAERFLRVEVEAVVAAVVPAPPVEEEAEAVEAAAVAGGPIFG
jgi:hypothetical protein